MNARCPECVNGLGELVEKDSAGGTVTAGFECSDCGHEWTIAI